MNFVLQHLNLNVSVSAQVFRTQGFMTKMSSYSDGTSVSCKGFDKSLEFAAEGGYLALIKGLSLAEAKIVPLHVVSSMFWRAAGSGHLDVVEWLHTHTHRSEGCSARAINKVAQNGHLGVVEWLHTHRSEGCTTGAMDWAARNRHVVAWLHTHRSEG